MNTTPHVNDTDSTAIKLANLIPDWAELIASLKPEEGYWLTDGENPVSDAVYPSIESAEFALAGNDEASDTGPVSICLTIGWTPEDNGWSYQTGDNSYTGGAYGHPHWAVVWLNADSVPSEVASDIADQLAELSCS